MVARRTSSAGFVAGARPDGVSGAIRRVDFYAKLPSELAEGSIIGGLVSIIATAAFVALFLAQFRALHQINFKLELPELSCEWATVDVVDALGARRFNISGEQLYKHALGSDSYLGVEHASVTAGKDKFEVDTTDTDVDHYGGQRIAYEITGATFDRMVKAHRVLLVNFHAPWCSHCQALAPVFEHAAELVRDDLKASKRARLAAGLATVDCTLEVNKKLCAEQQIQAFPSLRLYRSENMGKKDSKATPSGSSPQKQLQFEAYHGDRRAEDIAAYAHEALDETLHAADARHESSYDDDEGKARAKSATHKAQLAAGARKALGGTSRTSGCVIDGSVRVNRVPGALYVTPHSVGHAINTDLINMTHTIKHLSFGKHVPGGKPHFVPRALRNTWARVPKDMGGKFAAADLSKKKSVQNHFVSDAPFTVHEHHLNVVGRTFEPLEGPRSAIRLYEYTFNSNRFVLEPPFDQDDQRIDGAAVKFSFDISPMRVVSKETKKPVLDWTLGVMALVGGVYTCSGLLTGILENTAHVVKRRIGKHA